MKPFKHLALALGLALGIFASAPPAEAQSTARKPNIVIIWGDDIGQSNISAYTMGLMGYRTPNIDRVAKEGMIFTDYYAEQSCTAGRASFITGQHGLRTGLTKVGLPGATAGPAEGRPDDRRAAQAARLRDRPVRQEPPGRPQRVPAHRPRLRRVLRQPLPPERRGRAGAAATIPRTRRSAQKYGPRGVLDCKATDEDDPTVDPRFGKVGKQTIKDTGPLTRKRMETIDDDIAARAVDFIERQTEGRQAVLRLGELHPHALPHARRSRRASASPAAGRASITTR